MEKAAGPSSDSTILKLAMELASLPSEADIGEFVARRLMDISGAAAAWFCDFDKSDRALVLTHLELKPGMLEKVTGLMGLRPHDIRIPLDEAAYLDIVSNTVGRKQTLTELSLGAVPAAAGAAVQRLLGIDHFKGISFATGGDLEGIAMLAMKSGGPDLSDELLGPLAHMVAMSLKRRKAEELLRESEKKYRLISEAMADVVWTQDLELNTTYVSPSVQKVLGFTPEERRSQGIERQLTPESLDLVRESFAEELKLEEEGAAVPGRTVTLELEYLCKNGSTVWIESKMSWIRDENGRISGIHGVGREITERRMLQELLIEARKMETVGRLAGGVAHEFNNLLTCITGNTELAIMDLGPAHPLYDMLANIKKASEIAANLTSQLLAFSRKQVAVPRVIELDKVLAGMRRFLEQLMGEDTKVEISRKNDTGQVRFDPAQLRQIVVNLALNSRQAMPGGGHLLIETSGVRLDEAYCRRHPYMSPGEYVMFSVADTGCGMAEDVKRHVFEPFFTTREIGQGTGLGLPTVYGIVRQNGGSIDVESEPGKGTVVKIYMPRVGDVSGKPPV